MSNQWYFGECRVVWNSYISTAMLREAGCAFRMGSAWYSSFPERSSLDLVGTVGIAVSHSILICRP